MIVLLISTGQSGNKKINKRQIYDNVERENINGSSSSKLNIVLRRSKKTSLTQNMRAIKSLTKTFQIQRSPSTSLPYHNGYTNAYLSPISLESGDSNNTRIRTLLSPVSLTTVLNRLYRKKPGDVSNNHFKSPPTIDQLNLKQTQRKALGKSNYTLGNTLDSPTPKLAGVIQGSINTKLDSGNSPYPDGDFSNQRSIYLVSGVRKPAVFESEISGKINNNSVSQNNNSGLGGFPPFNSGFDKVVGSEENSNLEANLVNKNLLNVAIPKTVLLQDQERLFLDNDNSLGFKSLSTRMEPLEKSSNEGSIQKVSSPTQTPENSDYATSTNSGKLTKEDEYIKNGGKSIKTNGNQTIKSTSSKQQLSQNKPGESSTNADNSFRYKNRIASDNENSQTVQNKDNKGSFKSLHSNLGHNKEIVIEPETSIDSPARIKLHVQSSSNNPPVRTSYKSDGLNHNNEIEISPAQTIKAHGKDDDQISPPDDGLDHSHEIVIYSPPTIRTAEDEDGPSISSDDGLKHVRNPVLAKNRQREDTSAKADYLDHTQEIVIDPHKIFGQRHNEEDGPSTLHDDSVGHHHEIETTLEFSHRKKGRHNASTSSTDDHLNHSKEIVIQSPENSNRNHNRFNKTSEARNDGLDHDHEIVISPEGKEILSNSNDRKNGKENVKGTKTLYKILDTDGHRATGINNDNEEDEGSTFHNNIEDSDAEKGKYKLQHLITDSSNDVLDHSQEVVIDSFGNKHWRNSNSHNKNEPKDDPERSHEVTYTNRKEWGLVGHGPKDKVSLNWLNKDAKNNNVLENLYQDSNETKVKSGKINTVQPDDVQEKLPSINKQLQDNIRLIDLGKIGFNETTASESKYLKEPNNGGDKPQSEQQRQQQSKDDQGSSLTKILAIPLSLQTTSNYPKLNNQRFGQANLVKIKSPEALTQQQLDQIGYLGRIRETPTPKQVLFVQHAQPVPQPRISQPLEEYLGVVESPASLLKHKTQSMPFANVHEKDNGNLSKLNSKPATPAVDHTINDKEDTTTPLSQETISISNRMQPTIERNEDLNLSKLPLISKGKSAVRFTDKVAEAYPSAPTRVIPPSIYVLAPKTPSTLTSNTPEVNSAHSINLSPLEVVREEGNKIDLSKFSLGSGVLIPLLLKQDISVKKPSEEYNSGNNLHQRPLQSFTSFASGNTNYNEMRQGNSIGSHTYRKLENPTTSDRLPTITNGLSPEISRISEFRTKQFEGDIRPAFAPLSQGELLTLYEQICTQDVNKSNW